MGGELPKGHIEFINTLWNSYWGSNNFGTLSSWRSLGVKCQAETALQRVQFTNTAFYSPVNYLFQVVGMVAARFVTSSPLPTHQAACFTNVIAYVAILVVAIELMPQFPTGTAAARDDSIYSDSSSFDEWGRDQRFIADAGSSIGMAASRE